MLGRGNPSRRMRFTSAEGVVNVAVEDDGILVRRARVAELIDLRHAVLRQGLPRAEAHFPGDDAPSSRHYGAFRGDEALCCATLHASEWAGEPAYQLRGMATAPQARRMGLAKRVMDLIERDLRDAGGTLLMWCNARVPAVEFYRSMGWEVVSEPFEIPSAGPHVRMVKWLAAGKS
jgi:GNAT superfamily N-acetyltransferase